MCGGRAPVPSGPPAPQQDLPAAGCLDPAPPPPPRPPPVPVIGPPVPMPSACGLGPSGPAETEECPGMPSNGGRQSREGKGGRAIGAASKKNPFHHAPRIAAAPVRFPGSGEVRRHAVFWLCSRRPPGNRRSPGGGARRAGLGNGLGRGHAGFPDANLSGGRLP